jgi:hypothetical protein
MIGSDIELDYNGNTIINNGDFTIEEDSSLSYLNRMLVSSPGSWYYHPSLGIGIKTYLNNENLRDNTKNLKMYINGTLASMGVMGSADITTNMDTLTVNITSIDAYSMTQKTSGFKFNYMNGNITYDQIAKEVTNTTDSLHIKSTNKYRDRR